MANSKGYWIKQKENRVFSESTVWKTNEQILTCLCFLSASPKHLCHLPFLCTLSIKTPLAMSVPLPFSKMTVKVTHEDFLLSVSLLSLCIGLLLVYTVCTLRERCSFRASIGKAEQETGGHKLYLSGTGKAFIKGRRAGKARDCYWQI